MDPAVIYLAGVNWIGTTILVDSALFAPFRNLVDALLPDKVAELVHCHLCMGTWVGFGIAAVAGGPFDGFFGFFLNALTYKAGGHVLYLFATWHRSVTVRAAAETRAAARR